MKKKPKKIIPPIHSNKMPQSHYFSNKMTQSHYFLFILIFIVLIACYHIIKAYIHPIILALVLSIVFNPIHRKIEYLCRNRKNLAAFVSCNLLTLVVIIPVIFLLFVLIQQGVASFNAMNEWIIAGKYEKILNSPVMITLSNWIDTHFNDLKKYFPDMNLKQIQIDTIILSITKYSAQHLLNQGTNIVTNITAIIGKFFLMIFTFYFINRDHDQIVKTIFHLIPLSTTHETRIIQNIRSVARSALLGTCMTGVAQGIAGGIAFWICGLPAFFWGTIMAFASLIPIVGTGLIWIPAAGYLMIYGYWGYGLFMIIWCGVVVGMIDNFVRPLFMQGETDMSTLLIFFSILGGVSYFGLIGVLYGPLIFGLAVVLLYIYKIEFEPYLSDQDQR